jgi:hypothetical protein
MARADVSHDLLNTQDKVLNALKGSGIDPVDRIDLSRVSRELRSGLGNEGDLRRKTLLLCRLAKASYKRC